MKIGIICYPSIGGSGMIATELGLRLASRGHEIHFVSYSVPFRLSKFDRNVYFHAVDPINYPLFNQTLYTFSLTAKIVEVVKEYDLDLVHAHYSIPHSLCAHLAREVGGRDFKIVTTLHGTDVTIVGQNKPLYLLNKYGIEKSDTVTTVSQFQKEHTIQHFGVGKEIEVIYNFVDPNLFKPGGTGDHCCLAKVDEKILMHVSNFRPPKNPTAVIETFHRVQKEIPSKLVLIGDGPGIGEIRSLCHEYDICRHVCFLGKHDNVENLIPLADCVFQPSLRESFGMVLLEAMSCEIPTVSSNVDGIPEVVVHGETGFMADPDDYRSMAKYITDLFSNPELSRRLGRNGRKRAIERFNCDDMITRYIECYNRVLA